MEDAIDLFNTYEFIMIFCPIVIILFVGKSKLQAIKDRTYNSINSILWIL